MSWILVQGGSDARNLGTFYKAAIKVTLLFAS